MDVFLDLYNIHLTDDCECLDFDANQAHKWIPFPPDDDFFQDLNRGDIPDWLKIQESDEAIHAALCRAKPQDNLPSCAKHEPDSNVKSPPSVVHIEKLPFESLLPLINTYQFPASHKGLESVPFWIKIYSRFSTSYGFYFVAVSKNNEFTRFRQEVLESSDVWILPYWCLLKGFSVEWYRCMVLVFRDPRQGSPWGERILDAYHFLKTIASVSVSNNRYLGRLYHIANPMIPHALQWICHLMPDCFKNFQRNYRHEYPVLSRGGLWECYLSIGSEGEYIDKSHPVLRKEIPSILPMTGGPFMLENECFFIVKDYTERQLQDLLRRTGAKIWNEGE